MFDDVFDDGYTRASANRGDPPEGNWVFLLPSLELGRVLCVGQPTPGVRKTLVSLAREVGQTETLDETAPGLDLIFLANGPAKVDWDEVTRLLSPSGTVYYEDRGERIAEPPPGLTLRQCLWLTPAFGRVHTAVPLSDLRTMDYFENNGLASTSINPQTFDRLKRMIRGFSRPSASPTGAAAAPSNGSVAPSNGWKASVRTALRRTRTGIIQFAERLERSGTRFPLAKQLLNRRGVLLTAGGGELDALPAYLEQIARDNGLVLDSYRWGFAARGKYPSQKLLFFLFAGDTDRPTYVVKIVRDAVFNPGLERSHRGLEYVQQHGAAPAGTTPQTAFFGYHRGLAAAAETVIDGVPFESRSQFDAACPYAREAVDWFVGLATRTVGPPAPDLASAFERLVGRLTEVYAVAPDHRRFLEAQVETIRRLPPPTVFEHGDAGTWNLLVTDDGHVAFLDWENATSQGVPLWDLLYFFRALCVAAGQKSGKYSNLAAVEYFFLHDSPISPLIVESIDRYCTQIGLPRELVKPLFYLCWTLWAVKQSALVEPSQHATAHFWQVLLLSIEKQDAPTLARIFAA